MGKKKKKQKKPLEPEPTVEETAIEPEQFVVSTKIEPEDGPFVQAIKELPDPMTVPTDRWYGEVFLPQYKRVRNKLRQLAGL